MDLNNEAAQCVHKIAFIFNDKRRFENTTHSNKNIAAAEKRFGNWLRMAPAVYHRSK